ncbi:fructokinase [Humibacillus xanthopallidus]|uniref:Fructokinase n=1 Tax=Humibacillus xanthopallidus TaxID=412689 RepID=A0A543PRK8_9MICO|nr:PfkB family carbohydrate kinase [Humibacillus xanthopallidus]TQN46712.1 fructokinase [Humibacillus xanthopallidus]
MSTVPVRTLVIGEALVDAVTDASGTVTEHVGGSPANVAFGLAALDHPVDLATWIATDERGRRIEAVCRERGVALTPGSQDAPFTTVAHATLDASGAATYVFDLDWRLAPIADLTAYGHVHTGSIAAVLEPGGADVRAALAAARATGATVSYDPNARPSLMGAPADARRLIEEAVASADVVKLSDEDIEWLCPGEALEDVIAAWGTLGPALIVVTRGGAGAVVSVPATGEVESLPAPAVDVVDTVGAGDSFMAGLVSGLLDAGLLGGSAQRESLRAAALADVAPAVRRALRTGALTVERAGAHAPHRADLAETG